MASDKLLILNDENFEDELKNHKLVLIDTWAEWCSPCKAIEPLFLQLAGKYGDKITFAKLNTDENLSAAQSLRVMSIPTFLVFQDGKLLTRWTGAKSDKLISEVEKLVKG